VTGPTIQIIYPNFSRVDEKHNPPPIRLEGLEIETSLRKVSQKGNSKAVTFKEGQLALVANREFVKTHFVTDKKGEQKYHLLVSTPSDEEAQHAEEELLSRRGVNT